MGWCTFWLNGILDHIFGKTTYTAPTTLYLGLAASVAAGGGVTGEPSGSNYARVSITNNVVNFPTAGGGSKTAPGTGNWTFNPATGSWGTVNVFFFSDQATGNANTLGWGQLTVNKTINSGDTAYFNTNDVTVNIT
jgi:hypothetical protein